MLAGQRQTSQHQPAADFCRFFRMQAKCDRHMETFMKSIRAAAASEGQGFAAVKVQLQIGTA